MRALPKEKKNQAPRKIPLPLPVIGISPYDHLFESDDSFTIASITTDRILQLLRFTETSENYLSSDIPLCMRSEKKVSGRGMLKIAPGDPILMILSSVSTSMKLVEVSARNHQLTRCIEEYRYKKI